MSASASLAELDDAVCDLLLLYGALGVTAIFTALVGNSIVVRC